MNDGPAPSKIPGDQTIPIRAALGWGLGSLGMAALFQAFSVLLLRYLTDFLGIAALAAGFMISASKLFDAAIDPLIGSISDRTRSPWGRRRPFLLAGGLLSSLALLMMFNIPLLPSLAVRTGLVEVMLLVFALGYGLFNIPYLAMPAEMSTSPHERTKLISYRVAAVGVGSLFASVGGPWLITTAGGGLAGHKVMALAVSSLAAVASLGCFAFTGGARFTQRLEQKSPSFIQQIRLARENKPFLNLVLVKLAGLVGTGITFAIIPFVFIDILRSNYGVMGIYFSLYFGCLILGQPFWVIVCRRFGKKTVYLAAAPLIMAAAASWLLAKPGEPLALILMRAAAQGLLGGSTLLIIQGMLPDTIQYDFILTGLRREGVYAGVYTTIEKVGLAASTGIVGVLLGAFGYVSSKGVHIGQTGSARLAIYLLAASPALFIAVSAVILLGYHLPEASLATEEEAVMAEGPVPVG
jgi:GPH family glycoside/pentoside/hexuronide:cation symporter